MAIVCTSMLARIPSHNRVEGGIATALDAAPADLIDCFSGQIRKKEKITFGRTFQAPFHGAVKLWLRLLSYSTQIEKEIHGRVGVRASTQRSLASTIWLSSSAIPKAFV